jgi:chemotaxis protein CheY-P-specific phosphatase CheC
LPLDHTDLREMKKRQDVEGLLGVLETGDIKECREAICILGELRTKKAIMPLIGFLETDDIHIRSNAAWALGEIGHIKSVLPLIGLLNDPIDNVRINAAWSLGRIGDKRALSALRSSMKNGSTDLRKHAKEAISRIESNGNEKRYDIEEDETDIVDVPLITLEVPSEMECKYISRVEDDSSQTDYENTTQFSRDVQIIDTGNSDRFTIDDTRKILLGLKNESQGLVSVDILFRYKNNNGERQTSSVWLQMSTAGKNGNGGRHNIETVPEMEGVKRRITDSSRGKARIKHSRKPKPLEYDLPEETGSDSYQEESTYDEFTDPEEYPEEKSLKRKDIKRREKKSHIREKPEEGETYSWNEEELRDAIKSEKVPRKINTPTESEVKGKPEVKPVKDSVEPSVPQKLPEQPVQEIKASKPEVKPVKYPVEPSIPQKLPEQPVQGIKASKPEVKPVKDSVEPLVSQKMPEQPKHEVRTEPVKEQVKSEVKPSVKQEVIPPASDVKPQTSNAAVGGGNVDSAVRLLSDIGMSGMTNAASTVTQLSGEEAESLHSQLRTLPINEMQDEITGLGDNIVIIGVGLHGKGPTGEVNGDMQMYISSQNALDVANELLCNTPDTAIKEFNDDIISTLKETANIFGGQYVSAISEYIEVPLLLKAPSFKMGNSSQIAESVLKDIEGKVEFALATNLSLGNNRTGRLIMLVDPKSFDTIIQKLFG